MWTLPTERPLRWVNPATGQVIDTVPEATLEDLDRAIGLAVEGARRSGTPFPCTSGLPFWRSTASCSPGKKRVEKIARVMCEEGRKTPLRRQAQRRLCGAHGDSRSPPEMDIARDMEVFGPVWPVIPFDTLEEALEIANNTIFGLSSGVITSNIANRHEGGQRDSSGGACVINGTGNYRLAHQPFGGYKYSGVGREGAVSTLEK